MAAAAAAARERRREQLRRWEAASAASATPTPAAPSSGAAPRARAVRFERAAEFRAVCAGAELAEARAMVRAGGGSALLGGANADGVSALHQACLDEKMEVVQFLVESGADVNQADDEGWTPLHVAAACGYGAIAQYLLAHGADAAAVTSEGQLPLEVAEDQGLRELLGAELARRGVDVEAAKRAEEERMLRDTRRWVATGEIRDPRHPATGASALHVAAAKGYMEVLRLLLQAGYDPDVRDKDGWTPLHAAAHWGVGGAVRLLAEHLCDMAPRNNVGLRPCDLADEETLPLLQELQRQQHHLRSQKESGAAPPPMLPDPENPPTPAGGGKQRRSWLCRRGARARLSQLDRAQERAGPPLPLPPPGDEDGDEAREGQPDPPHTTPPRLRPPRAAPPAAPPPPRTGSLGALAPPPVATPPVRRSASSPRLDAPPTELPQLLQLWTRPLGPPSANQHSPSAPANQDEANPSGDPTPEPRPDHAPPSPASAEPRPRRSPRDEEAESQRRARSRLMRQSRRSTQGVTLTELKEAEKTIGRGREGRGQEEAPPPEQGHAHRSAPPTPGAQETPPHSPPQPPNGLLPPHPSPPAFSYEQLYEELWGENERLREQLQETELKLTQLKLELERVTQQHERIAERPALLELERFERRALERKAAELEEELKALSDLRADNQRLKDENAALIRVISKLSK